MSTTLAHRDYLEFELELSRHAIQASAGASTSYVASVRSPVGEAEAQFQLPFTLEGAEAELLRVENALLRASSRLRRSHNSDKEMLQEFGERLFGAVFTPEIQSKYAACKARADNEDKGLRLRLIVRPPELAALPWELLCEPHAQGFVALSKRHPFVRYLRGSSPPKPVTVSWPLRVLAISASPADQQKLNVELEEENLQKALAGLGQAVELSWIRHADREALRRALKHPWHILHFAGHGGYDSHTGEGFLVLEAVGGGSEQLDASKLQMLLDHQTSLSLVVLSACEGARQDARRGVSSTAAKLVELGVPAVIGMQYPVSDDAAIEFTRVLYDSLAEGFPIDAAVAAARQSLHLGNSFEWITPIVFMRAPNGVLFQFSEDRGSLPPPLRTEPLSSSPRAQASSKLPAATPTAATAASKRHRRWILIVLALTAVLSLVALLFGGLLLATSGVPTALLPSVSGSTESVQGTLPLTRNPRLGPVPSSIPHSEEPKLESSAPSLGEELREEPPARPSTPSANRRAPPTASLTPIGIGKGVPTASKIDTSTLDELNVLVGSKTMCTALHRQTREAVESETCDSSCQQSLQWISKKCFKANPTVASPRTD